MIEVIKVALEQAIRNIEVDKERKITEVKDRVTREKILPFNTDVDNARAKALAEIDNEFNQRVAELKQECEVKKQELVKLGEEKKKANADSVLATELAIVTIEYDAHIAKLNAQISEISE